MTHDRPVRLTSHDNAHAGLFGAQDSQILSFLLGISRKNAKSFTITKYAAAMLKGRLRIEKSLFAIFVILEPYFAIEMRLSYFKLSMLTPVGAGLVLIESEFE